MTGARVISQLHGTEAWDVLPNRLIAPLRSADLVLCVSHDTRDRLVEQAPELAASTSIVHNTVGPQFDTGDRDAARARFGIEDEFVLLSVGRLDERDGYKGHDRVIPLLKGLSLSFGNVRYLIAGRGPDLSRLQALVKSHDADDLVTFLHDVPAAQLPDLYRAADLFVLPSTGEGFGIVYVEAMACGTPAIGLNVGGAPDALSDPEFSFVADPEEFASVLDKAIRSSKIITAQDRGRLSRRVRERFGHARFTSRIESILEPLLD